MELKQDVKPGMSFVIVDGVGLVKRVIVDAVTLRYNEVSGELVPYVDVTYRVLGTEVGGATAMPLTGFLGFRWVFETQQVDPALVERSQDYADNYPGITGADAKLREAIFAQHLVYLIADAKREATL